MTTICLTGSTDGIGLAAARTLLAGGARVLVHARSEQRGRPDVQALADRTAGQDGGGEVDLVVADLASLTQVRALADRLREEPLDVLVHNAGVWVRGSTPPLTDDGFETTFGVNVLAPHLLTALLAGHLGARGGGRLVWLGSGMAGSGRLKPTALGGAREPRQAYADSKAADVVLASVWGRRLGLPSAAVDPGWVRTKLASAGAPGEVEQGADTVAWCCTSAPLADAPYWKDRAPLAVPGRLRDRGLQDAVAAACDRLVGLPPRDEPAA